MTSPGFQANLSAVMSRYSHQPTKPLQTLQRSQAIALTTTLALILTTTALLLYTSKPNPNPTLLLSDITSNTFRPSVESMNGTDIIWQIPDSPKAVLFLAHGCNGRAANFWDRSPECPNCVGLPEERLIALRALERKFAVMAISSLGRCWSFGKEKENVKWMIKWWIEKHKLEMLPVTALGASSGGYFVSALAAEVRFSSITLMIAEGVFDRMDIPKEYPPTLFVHMPKDHTRMELITGFMETLRQKGIAVKEVRCMEFPLTPTLLCDRIPGFDRGTAGRLFELFREEGFVDGNGYMKNDGRATRWKKALRKRNISLGKHEWLDHIQEELNLAFAYHEMTSLLSDVIFDWFESHMSQSTASGA